MAKKYPGYDKLPVKCIEYQDNFLPEDLAKIAFSRLVKECTFRSDEDSAIKMYGKTINIPRKQVGYGDPGLTYSFTNISVDAVPWSDSPTLEMIKDIVIEKTGHQVSYALVNLYRNGDDYIGYHSDDEKDLDPRHPIISLSLGAARPFRLRHKVTGQIFEKVLRHNSLTLMNPPCQRVYKHSVPKSKKIKEPRLNITFRILRKKKTKR